MRPDPLAEAAARRHELTRAKAIQALRELDRAGAPVTFASVAAAAGISRSWLYTQPDISDQVRRLRGVTRERDPASVVPAGQRGEQRQRHREIHHHVRRQLPVRPPRTLASRRDHLIDSIPRDRRCQYSQRDPVRQAATGRHAIVRHDQRSWLLGRPSVIARAASWPVGLIPMPYLARYGRSDTDAGFCPCHG